MSTLIKIPDLEKADTITEITGFGASAAWWAQNISDTKTAREIARLLYGDSGLKMNIYRYNVGGGYENGKSRVPNPWRNAESFMDKNGGFDYSRDKNAVSVMRECLKTGNVDTLIFFANSPHYSMTVTGQASGGFEEHFSNLPKENYQKFAKYMIDIAEHFKNDGFPVKYISPINEPQWKWGGDIVWQEGCHYEPQEVADCLAAFAKELDKRNSDLMLYGPESGEISGLTQEYLRLISQNELTKKYIGTFAYHSYHSDDNPKDKINFGKALRQKCSFAPISMSEWCELPCKNDTNSIRACLINARIIGQDLILSGSDSWTAWVAVNQFDNTINEDGLCYADGLINANNDFSQYSIAKRYYAMAHFSKFVPAGSLSIDLPDTAQGECPVFIFRIAGGEYAVIAVNQGESNAQISFKNKIKSVKIIKTDAGSNLVRQHNDEHSATLHGSFNISANSIITAIINI